LDDSEASVLTLLASSYQKMSRLRWRKLGNLVFLRGGDKTYLGAKNGHFKN